MMEGEDEDEEEDDVPSVSAPTEIGDGQIVPDCMGVALRSAERLTLGGAARG